MDENNELLILFICAMQILLVFLSIGYGAFFCDVARNHVNMINAVEGTGNMSNLFGYATYKYKYVLI